MRKRETPTARHVQEWEEDARRQVAIRLPSDADVMRWRDRLGKEESLGKFSPSMRLEQDGDRRRGGSTMVEFERRGRNSVQKRGLDTYSVLPVRE
jgi:hypothetical protein